MSFLTSATGVTKWAKTTFFLRFYMKEDGLKYSKTLCTCFCQRFLLGQTWDNRNLSKPINDPLLFFSKSVFVFSESSNHKQ